MNIGFIGAGGNMAGAIIDSVAKMENRNFKLFLFSPHTEKLDKHAGENVTVCSSNVDVVNRCEIIFLCVKPQILPAVLDEIKPTALADKCFVSIAAGIKIDTIKAALGENAKVIRVMPNTPLMIGFGASGICKKVPVSDEEFELIVDIFGGKNVAVTVDESQMDAVTAVSGSGPAYVYRFVKDMAQSGQQLGLSFENSFDLALQTVLGAVMMMKDCDKSEKSLQQLIDKVTSPNGTTFAALQSMDKDDFDGAVKNALFACDKRSKELSKNK